MQLRIGVTDSANAGITQAITVTVTDVLDAAAVDDLFSAGEREVVVGDLLGNDAGVGALSIVSGGGAALGAMLGVTSAGGRTGGAFFAPSGELNFAFDPSGNFDDLLAGQTDTVTLAYTISDGTGDTDTASVVITVNGNGTRLIGDDQDNVLVGTGDGERMLGLGGSDTLTAHAGNDTLDGGTGADEMSGGVGDDVYHVDDAGDVIVEAADGGRDRVHASVSYQLPDHVETGKLAGSGDLTLAAGATGVWLNGNGGDNRLLGGIGADRLDGNAGNDTLDGGAGNDVQEGGAGADIFVLSDGNDTVLDFEIGTDLIDLTAMGIRFEDLTVRSSGDNLWLGHATGSLTLFNVAEGDLGGDAFLQPLSSTPPVVTGTGGNDRLTETAGPVELRGLGGDDHLRVYNGTATLVGGTGNDRYFVFDSATTVTELPGDGTEWIYAYVDFTMPDHVEGMRANGTAPLTLTGSDAGNWIQGNAGANTLIGQGGNDRLEGRRGADRIEGGTGTDLLSGGLDADTFAFRTGDGIDTITDFETAADRIDLTATGLAFEDPAIRQNGTETLIDTTPGDRIILQNTDAGTITEDQFLF